MNQKSITNFLSNEYKGFAFYVIENRALPSVIDGFKPTQRKIIHVCSQIWKTGAEKPLKVFQLGGKVASDAFYHHGNMSLENAIVTMAQKFKNNAALLEEVGQYGSLRSPQAGAPRYIGTKLNNNFKLIYKDSDLLEFKEEEGESIEPHYFLPIIPMVLFMMMVTMLKSPSKSLVSLTSAPKESIITLMRSFLRSPLSNHYHNRGAECCDEPARHKYICTE